MEIKGRIAVITGGNRGIGSATSLCLASREADIAVIYNTGEEKAVETKTRVEKLGRKCNIYKCDVSSFTDTRNTIEKIINDFGRIDMLVNSAGIVIEKPFLQTEEETWDRTIDVNLKGVFNMCRFVIPNMLKNGGGKIVNISSIAGRNGGNLGVPYAASKSGVIGITYALAAEFTPKKILVNAIAPGPVDTDFTKRLPDDIRKRLEALSPLGRFALPEEIAHTIAFLIENDYISGEVINVNAGRYMN